MSIKIEIAQVTWYWIYSGR